MTTNITSKVKWQEIDKVGIPPKSLRTIDSNGTPVSRTFLLRGEYSITTAYAFDDGSGFMTDNDYSDNITAWAIVDGF